MMNPWIFFIIISILSFTACRNGEVPGTRTEVVRVRVAAVTEKVLSIPLHSTGTLVSSEELKLSFKTGGIIASINVKEGERVREGDLLASLVLSEINASLSQAENAHQKAFRDHTRAENLYRDSVATLEQKQNAATALDIAKANLEIARFNLKHSSITAPGNGLILKQFARSNELVGAGFPVFLFGEKGKYRKIKTALSDKDVVKVNRGDSAVILFDAYPDVKFTAVVEQVGEMANPYTGTYETELLVDDMGYRLASGFIAGVDIYPSLAKSFTMVPIRSVVEADGSAGFVYAVTDSMTAQKFKIKIEGISGAEVAVTGIPANVTEIVTEGVAYLNEGTRVSVVRRLEE